MSRFPVYTNPVPEKHLPTEFALPATGQAFSLGKSIDHRQIDVDRVIDGASAALSSLALSSTSDNTTDAFSNLSFWNGDCENGDDDGQNGDDLINCASAAPDDPMTSSSNKQVIDGAQESNAKTPMCLVTDLARYNKLTYQYKLIDESGPAHQKQFIVSLILRDGIEEYVGEGTSIKKAQHAAAVKALEQTQLPRPPSQRFCHKRQPTAPSYGYKFNDKASLTPTVMLNTVAANLGLSAQYSFFNGPPCPPRYPSPNPPYYFPFGAPPNFARNMNCFSVPPPPLPPLPLMRQSFAPSRHQASVRVGRHEFFGQGMNRQLAKHDAALKALRALEPLVQQQAYKPNLNSSMNGPSSRNNEIPKKVQRAEPVDPVRSASSSVVANAEASESCEKSPISIVLELALQQRLLVSFEIISESGPAHNRRFLIRCSVKGPNLDLTADGVGSTKKQAKHIAAEKIITELKQYIETPAPDYPSLRNSKSNKEKRRKATIIKDIKSDPNYGQQINPVSRLIQIQQTKKESEPVFEFMRENGQGRNKEFVMKVTIGDQCAEGTGPNKKFAKRAAAEEMLEQMGFAKPLPMPGKPVLKRHSPSPESSSCETITKATNDSEEGSEVKTVEKTRKVKFMLDEYAASDREHSSRGMSRRNHNRQIAPGLLFMPSAFHIDDNFSKSAEYVFDNTATLPSSSSGGNNSTSNNAREQLQYLATILNVPVQFSDFPKSFRSGDSGEFLSLVSLETKPPLVCHGAGPTIQQAQNEAAQSALRLLSETGLQSAERSADDVSPQPNSTSSLSTNAEIRSAE